MVFMSKKLAEIYEGLILMTSRTKIATRNDTYRN